MKRINNLFDRICSLENISIADECARRNKSTTYGVRLHDKHREEHLLQLQQWFFTGTYKTSQYSIYTIKQPKERIIYRLPYFPDRIAHHAIMNVLEEVWEKIFISNSYSCRKRKGIHKAVNDIKKDIKQDPAGVKYCLKLDIVKFYPSINHDILKQVVRRKIKDYKLLDLLDSIIDSAPGVPIGNYLSQYFANLYLTYFDHWLKEVKGIKYYYRYADDIVILHESKEDLHNLLKEIEEYLDTNLKLKVKRNYQVFPIEIRGIDFLGYRIYPDHILLRKRIKKNICKLISKVNKINVGKKYVQRKLCSYYGWMKYCNSSNFYNKVMEPAIRKYQLYDVDHFQGTETLMYNLMNKNIFIYNFVIRSKYIRIYAYVNKKPFIAKSSSTRLFKLLQEANARNRYCKIIRNKKNKYEVIL